MPVPLPVFSYRRGQLRHAQPTTIIFIITVIGRTVSYQQCLTLGLYAAQNCGT